jgi:hypothetical protein
MKTRVNFWKLGTACSAAFGIIVATIISAATQTPSGHYARDYFEPAVDDEGKVISSFDRIEITLLSRSEFLGIRVIQMTRLGAIEPDGFALDVPRPMYVDDASSGLYCYISTATGEAFKLAFNSDYTTPFEPIGGDAKAAMEDFAMEVKDATKDLNPARIGLGIVRKFPDSAFAAVNRVLNVSGGCNWPVADRVLGSILGNAGLR